MLFDVSLLTSFGPHGHSKIMRGPTGVIVVSKDGAQMVDQALEHMQRHNNSPVEKLLLQGCMSVSQRHGDGALSTAMLLEFLLQNWVLAMTSGDHASPSNQRRIYGILAIETTIHVMHSMEDEIRKHMVQVGCWCDMDNSNWVRALWVSALVPALNASSALTLDSILWRWLRVPDQVSSSSSSSDGEGCVDGNELRNLRKRCCYALSNYDTIVLSTVREGAALSDSYCTVFDEVIINGNLRDNTSLGRKAPHGGFRFVCIQELLQRFCASTTITSNVTVESNAHNQLASFSSGRLMQIKHLVGCLLDNSISLIFCCDRVDDAELFEMSARGMTIMDCVPIAHLQLLTLRGNTKLWQSAANMIETLGGVTGDGDRPYAVLGKVERMRLSKSEPSYRITGLDSGDLRGYIAQNLPPQIVLLCSSNAAGAIYNRLLRRCLLIASSSSSSGQNEEKDEEKIISDTGGHERASGMSSCLVPGAGASEMAWSLMWRMVGELLESNSAALPDKLEALESDTLAFFLQPLVVGISSRILDRLVLNIGTNRLALLQMISLCKALSAAYTQPAWHLLMNSGATCSKIENRSMWIDRLLLHWSHDLRHRGSETALFGKGRHGWVTSIGAEVDTLTSFEDCFAFGVVASAGLFWASFISVLEGCRFYLRTNGKVVRVRVKKEK